ARVAGDAAGGDVREAGQAGSHLQQLRLARERGGDQLHDVAEAAAPERLAEGGQSPSSLRTAWTPSTIAPSLANATSRGRCRRPQSGLTASRLAGTCSSPGRTRPATTDGVSTSWLLTSITPSPSVNGASNSSRRRTSSSPRRANSSVSCWTRASRTAGKR